MQGILEGNNPIARNLDAIACNVAGDNAIAIHLTPENIRIVAKNASVYNGIPDSAHHNAGAILTSHLNQQHHAIRQRKAKICSLLNHLLPTLVSQHVGERELLFVRGAILAQSMQSIGIMYHPSTDVIHIVMCWHSC